MTSLACTVVLRQLQAYHDDELRVADQIAVASHVDGCTSCHEALTELQTLGDTLRAAREIPASASAARVLSAAWTSASTNSRSMDSGLNA